MKYDLNLPLSAKEVKRLEVGDIISVSGEVFTARDSAHRLMVEKDKEDIDFNPEEMALYHCGPLMEKGDEGWRVISAGPTTSSRMEIFEDEFIEKFGVNLIIGKGSMGKKTREALQKYTCVYTSYTGGAGALAADSIKNVKDMYFLDQLGMAEAVWIFEVEKFGSLVVAIDSDGNSIYDYDR